MSIVGMDTAEKEKKEELNKKYNELQGKIKRFTEAVDRLPKEEQLELMDILIDLSKSECKMNKYTENMKKNLTEDMNPEDLLDMLVESLDLAHVVIRAHAEAVANLLDFIANKAEQE